jgi:carboxyl-terminal processing protease
MRTQLIKAAKMNRNMLVSGLLVLASFVGFRASADPLLCSHLPHIQRGFLNHHILFKAYTPALEARIIQQFIEKLDPSKIYLLQDDVNKITELMKDIYAKTQKEKCNPITEAHDIFVQRVKERNKYVEGVLGPKYKMNKDVELVLDPKKRQFPKDKAESDDFTVKYVHFQIANYLASGMKIGEAKTQLVRRYARNLKNLGTIKKEDIYASYLDSFAGAMDPHSSFLSPDAREDFDIQMQLSLEGIGATLSSQDGYTVIENLIPGGSAAKSSLIEPQDKIISVGQGEAGPMETVIDEPLRDVVRKIRGPKGSKVRLSMLRKANGKTRRIEVTLIRDKISLEDEAAQVTYVDKDVGGVKKKFALLDLPSFYSSSRRGGRSSASDMKKVLKDVREKKVDGMILDLSSNGGGSLDDAVKIAGQFIKTGNVVETQGASKAIDQMADDEPEVDYTGPLVVLTSRLSASASEIVAGALQDYRRGVIVGGDHTFGKGSVQQVMPLPSDLGALKVTVGMFFIPAGNSTQHRGVFADVPLPGNFSTDEIGEKSLDYSLPPRSLPNFVSAEAFVKEGPDAWTQVTPEMITQLKARSVKRVEGSEDFKKILMNLKKSEEEKNKPVKISEVMKDKEKSEAETKKKPKLTADAKKKEYVKRADVVEALNVLADLQGLMSAGGKLPPLADLKPEDKTAKTNDTQQAETKN